MERETAVNEIKTGDVKVLTQALEEQRKEIEALHKEIQRLGEMIVQLGNIRLPSPLPQASSNPASQRIPRRWRINRMAAVALVLASTAGLTGLGLALNEPAGQLYNPKTGQTNQAPVTQVKSTVKGVVQSVDSQSLQIMGDLGIALIKLDSNTVIKRNGKTVQSSDLKVGDKVEVLQQ